MKQRALVLFECVSELIACSLAGVLFVAVAFQAEQRLAPEFRLETIESQYADLWTVDAPIPDILPAPFVSFVLHMSAALTTFAVTAIAIAITIAVLAWRPNPGTGSIAAIAGAAVQGNHIPVNQLATFLESWTNTATQRR